MSVPPQTAELVLASSGLVFCRKIEGTGDLGWRIENYHPSRHFGNKTGINQGQLTSLAMSTCAICNQFYFFPLVDLATPHPFQVH
jgi:hypothetical protein